MIGRRSRMISRENEALIISSVLALLVLFALATFTNLQTLARVAIAVIVAVVAQSLIESFS